MKIGILATGTTPDELIAQYDSYANMFVQLFGKAGYDFNFSTFDVRDDVFPETLQGFDAWIITGSKFNVEDNDPWMIKLKQIIRDLYDQHVPILGICFGHQMVADAFDGEVGQNPNGWGVGLHSYRLDRHPKGIPAETQSFTISAMHRYQVTKKPSNAEVFASSEFCPFAGLVYDDRILTFQAHPEFMLDYEKQLVALRKGEVIPEEEADAGLATCNQQGAKTDSVELAHWMARFIQK